MPKSPVHRSYGRIADLLGEMLFLIRQTSDGRMLQVLQHADMTLPQILSLRLIQKHGSRRIGDLAAHLHLTASAVSRLVDRLVDKGLVDRKEHDLDRRQKSLRITGAGARLLKRIDTAREADLVRSLADLDPAIAADLENALGDVVDRLRAQQEQVVAQ